MIYIQHEIERFELSPRKHASLMRDLNREVLTNHSIKTLPKHFESNANTRPGGEYGYDTRSVKYTRTKRKKYGHAKPNVYTGKLRDAVLSKVRIEATQNKATMRTHGTPEHRLSSKQQREIEAVSIPERDEYARWQGREYAKRAFDIKYASRRRKRKG